MEHLNEKKLMKIKQMPKRDKVKKCHSFGKKVWPTNERTGCRNMAFIPRKKIQEIFKSIKGSFTLNYEKLAEILWNRFPVNAECLIFWQTLWIKETADL